MKYRLFLSDFDGTLVRADGSISETNKRAISRYTEGGGVFAVVTGRMLSSILPRLGELGLTQGLVVAYQGAVVADVKTGKIVRSAHFAAGDALRAVKALEEENHHIHVYTPQGLIANRRDALLEVYEKICGVRGEISNEPLSELLARENPPVYKVLAMLEPQKKAALKARLEEKLGEGFFVTCSSEWLVEIMPAGQNKGEAVKFLSQYYKIPLAETAAIGDQLNDLPMLLAAGGRFTVANAEGELKEIAACMPSNEEDGVAAAIEIAMEEEA